MLLDSYNQKIMAELGAIASGLGVASFAIRIADSLVWLKGFWVEAKKVPAASRSILEESELLSLVPFEINENVADASSPPENSVTKCVSSFADMD
ncbi:hypothetical protein NHQ30_000605 [Ciborinia camelliae]|nr:hypothetical protein NHQ30_000605 [Ciborinia camelliae]